jgi:hypothetical protein
MRESSDSTDRNVEEYLVFAVGFLGVLGAAGGIIVDLPGLACSGASISLLALCRFLLR